MNSELKNCTDSPVLTEMTPVNVSGLQVPYTDSASEVSTKKKKTAVTKEKIDKAIISCEWNLCVNSMKNMNKFLLHVAEHIEASNEPPTEEGYMCHWRNCGFVCQSKTEKDRHVYYHAFHSRIKGIGEIIMKEQNLQCTVDDQTRNLIPEFPERLECLWVNCNFVFISAQEFYWHAEAHARSVCHSKWTKENNTGGFLCSWNDCKSKTKEPHHLVGHVRSHTQEKLVACPNCGRIFASYSKFHDHCHRHIMEEGLKFECSHCKCKFATERLLNEHVRRHVNHFKCPHCEMTCPSRSAVDTHIIYRHSENKPLKCPECDKRFKRQHDIIKHLVVHSTEASFSCPISDCQFTARSYSAYHRHIRKSHTNDPDNPYMCHICEKKFRVGTQLTTHLKKMHDFHWPTGHARFRYSKDEDGYYKLQTTRFESIELAQAILNGEVEDNVDDPDAQLQIQYDTESQAASDTIFCSPGLIEKLEEPKVEDTVAGPSYLRMKKEENSTLQFVDL